MACRRANIATGTAGVDRAISSRKLCRRIDWRGGIDGTEYSRPQKEVRWLALGLLAYIGQFGDMVKALDDPARKLDWPE